MIPKANYTLALGIQEYNRQSQVASKMILFPQKDFPYAIDRKPGDICLADLTRCAIDFLQQKGNGFFLMIEGSKIDWAGHSRDGATNFREIKDLEEWLMIFIESIPMKPSLSLQPTMKPEA